MASRQKRVEFSGPFFERDPARTFRQNARKMLEGMGAEGEAAIIRESPILTGAFRAGVHARVAALSGKPWLLTMVISQQHVYRWPNGDAREYRGGKLEASRHMFRRTTAALRRSRAQASADLTAGMN